MNNYTWGIILSLLLAIDLYFFPLDFGTDNPQNPNKMLDLVFVIDTTGSMGPYIVNVQVWNSL
jgi:hypothetical protein